MSNTNTFAVQGLVVKMKNADADLRFMALTDLLSEIERCGDNFGVDEPTEHQVVEQILALMQDANGEVKNLAVKALAGLVKHVSENRMTTIIDRLVLLTANSDEGVRDIASLGLKTVVGEIGQASSLARTACEKLLPKLVAQLESGSSSPSLLIDCLDLSADMLARFEGTIGQLEPPHEQQKKILNATVPLLNHDRPAVRKRAVATLAILVASYDRGFQKLVTGTVIKNLKGSSNDTLRTSVSLVGALAKTAPTQMGRQAAELVPLVLASADKDDDELKEGVLQTLEALVLKCPTEVGPLIGQITDAGTALIKFDPNYAAEDDDEDVEMDDGDDEDEDDEFDDSDYDDDDDVSWKVRRSATKLLASCIATRSDLLSTFYKSIAPVLLSRFGEREETVRVEVWSAFTSLLTQTKVWSADGMSSSGGAAAPDSGNGRLKRKRSEEMMEVEDGPIALLRAMTAAATSRMMKQLTVKSLATRQAAFTLLHELIALLHGGLETQMSAFVSRVEAALKASDQGLSGAATSLKIEVLSLLGLLFKTHHLKTFQDELPKLVPLLVAAVGDKFNKIAAEAFVTATELVKVLRPINPAPAPLGPGTAPYLAAIYDATMARLGSSDADEEVKAKALVCLGALLVHAGDALATSRPTALALFQDRLRNEVSRLVAVKVVGEVATSPLSETSDLDQWVHACLIEVAGLLRKVSRPLKLASFNCINALLTRAGSDLPAASAQALLTEIEPLLSDQDANVLPLALHAVTVLLIQSNETLASVQAVVLPRALQLVKSPLVQGASLDALLALFVALVRAGALPFELVQALAEAADTQGKKEVDASGVQTGMSSLSAASRCIGVVVREAPAVADGVINEYAHVVSSAKSGSSPLILGLLTLGEIGRKVDLASHAELFGTIVGHFSSSNEDVRRSAAFAAGNFAVGNPTQFLPPIVQLIQTDDKKRYLALNALKEVIVLTSPEALVKISDSLWTPLFENCEAQEEGTRNVAAECLGQLTVINPGKYLPQLQARLSAESRHTRATVIAAIRFTFTNESSAYDALLGPLIVEFFKLIHDQDLGVRRLALSSLNSAAHNKPHLVRDHLSTLLPELYLQTEVDERLIRIVEMGPFKHKVDDGLDIRKTAYECMHTLLDTCVAQVEIHEYLNRVIGALSDEEDIKKLAYLMLVRVAAIAPAAVQARLDDTAQSFATVLETTLKETAVKQETERLVELQKAALRCLVALHKLASPAGTPKFAGMMQTQVGQGKWTSEYKELVQNGVGRAAGWDLMEM